MNQTIITTPIGQLAVSIVDDQINKLEFVTKRKASQNPANKSKLLKTLSKQLKAYFNDPNFTFDLPVLPQGTDFQRRVWAAMRAIPTGKTRTYQEIATRLGTSPRAVGNACRANPTPIIVPCHRIVAKQGLGGFAGKTTGFTMTIKQQLLQHENSHLEC